MRRIIIWLLALLLTALAPVQAASPKILKVLPHRLDRQGRHSLSPSLYERDAYQAWLRAHPEEVSGLRFDVCWKGPRRADPPLKLRLELRTARGKAGESLVLESAAVPDRLGATWSKLVVDGDTFRKVGEITAWRATLWSGDQLLAETKSFLW